MTIPLNRQFLEWHKEKPSDPDAISDFGLARDSLVGWEEISKRKRVVILAEAGSGKTEEMQEQARRRTQEGQTAFYATVEDVDRDGLKGALTPADQDRFAKWQTSGESVWFFIDSIDEAKLGRVPLERAIRRIAEGIKDKERQAHIILSCRLTDWEYARDLDRLSNGLPIPGDPKSLPSLTGDEILVKKLRRENVKESKPQTEQPLVVLLTALDPERIKLFATAKGLKNIDAFLSQLELANLWRFARRPLDLDWLVSIWQDKGQLGSLAEMLENSLNERSRESDLDRGRADSLDGAQTAQAIERIGAALVFGRKATISIPDSELLRDDDERPLDLAQTLPELSARNRTLLLSRPVFDPATFGRARLHNDNRGVVRAYLTARWLKRLRATNLSRKHLFELLFATSYGIDLIKPSMRETTAWLSIWDEEVQRAVIRRDPLLLMTAGDPASLSMNVRETILTAVVDQFVAGKLRLGFVDNDSLRRFAQADLSDHIKILWKKHANHAETRNILLELIWLGQLESCVSLAEDIAYKKSSERISKIIAGRALVASGNDSVKKKYAKFITTNCKIISNTLIWDALDGLFPAFLTVNDLLKILKQIDITDNDSAAGFAWQSPGLIDRLNNRNDLERLLKELLAQLGAESQDIGHIPDKREEAYLSAIAACACRLLGQYAADEASDDVIDAAMRVGASLKYDRPIHEPRSIAKELHQTKERRRFAFWRVTELRTGHPWLRGQPISNLFQFDIFGYSSGLKIEDIEWLLVDAKTRSSEDERKLAIIAALQLARSADSPSGLLAQIEKVASLNPVTKAVYEGWVNPPPASAEEIAHERQMQEFRDNAEEKQKEIDKSWKEFIGNLRKDPQQLRAIQPNNKEIDRRLYDLWQLLSNIVDAGSRYAIDSVAPIEPIVGPEVAVELSDALIRHWKNWLPKLISERDDQERNKRSYIDLMGITGISLEASKPRWAEKLSSDEAKLAAKYATLEINGFPSWLSDLAVAKPTEVQEILFQEIVAGLSEPERSRYGMLDDISHADKSIITLMAPALYSELQQRNKIPMAALRPLLSIVEKGLEEKREELLTFAIDQFEQAKELATTSCYLEMAFAMDTATATDKLMSHLEKLDARAQTALAEQILPTLFGTGFSRQGIAGANISFAALERLIAIAFRTLRVEEDNQRPSGEVFSPDGRDHAQHARSAAFQQLADTPGMATFAALQRLADNPDCPVSKERLRELALVRAALDSENIPWSPADSISFEKDAEKACITAKELQQTAMSRFEDMQHELLHHEFQQGTTLQALPNENAVQRWIADRLDLKKGIAYSVDREPHVAEEKEPDVRLRAKASNASLPIEVKVAASWSLKELEDALQVQLAGRYLRDRDARHGILLLVYQNTRPKGWEDMQTKDFLNYDEVVNRLKKLATQIASTSPDAPVCEIAVLDVSSCCKIK